MHTPETMVSGVQAADQIGSTLVDLKKTVERTL